MASVYRPRKPLFHFEEFRGNFLKPDVWVQEFCRWYGAVDAAQLADLLRKEAAHCGEFDAFLWWYCHREIGETEGLTDHFNELSIDHTNAVETVTVAEIESTVWKIEGVRIVVRDRSDGCVRSYGYKNAANRNRRATKSLMSRIFPLTEDREVIVVDGWGEQPHGNTRLQTLRESYRESTRD